MSMTSTRMREARRRRARREVQLTIVLHEHDLAEIAKRGYQSAAPTGLGGQPLRFRHALGLM